MLPVRSYSTSQCSNVVFKNGFKLFKHAFPSWVSSQNTSCAYTSVRISSSLHSSIRWLTSIISLSIASSPYTSLWIAPKAEKRCCLSPHLGRGVFSPPQSRCAAQRLGRAFALSSLYTPRRMVGRAHVVDGRGFRLADISIQNFECRHSFLTHQCCRKDSPCTQSCKEESPLPRCLAPCLHMLCLGAPPELHSLHGASAVFP
jgi:hypothetical protein